MTLDARFTLLNAERDAVINTESLDGSEIPTNESISELDAVVDHWAPHPLNTYSDFSSECSYDACYPDVDMSEESYERTPWSTMWTCPMYIPTRHHLAPP